MGPKLIFTRKIFKISSGQIDEKNGCKILKNKQLLGISETIQKLFNLSQFNKKNLVLLVPTNLFLVESSKFLHVKLF